MVVYVLNLDDQWNFPDLAIQQGLDLFPLDRGVELIDFVPPVAPLGGLNALFTSWPDQARKAQRGSAIQRFVDAVEQQASGTRDHLVVCLSYAMMQGLRPPKPAPVASVRTETQEPPGVPYQRPPKIGQQGVSSARTTMLRPEGPAASDGGESTEALSELLETLATKLAKQGSTRKQYSISFFCSADTEHDAEETFVSGRSLLGRLPDTLRWRASVVVCVDGVPIIPSRKFDYLRALLDLLTDASAREDGSKADVFGKLFVDESTQHSRAGGTVIRMAQLMFGKTLSASMISALAVDIQAQATGTPGRGADEADEKPAEEQYKGVINNLQLTTDLVAAAGGTENRSKLNFAAMATADDAITKARTSIDEIAQDRQQLITEGFNKASIDLVENDRTIEKHRISVGRYRKWRDDAETFRKKYLTKAGKAADDARTNRQRTRFLSMTKGPSGNFEFNLQSLPTWTKAQEQIQQYFRLRGEHLSFLGAALLGVTIASLAVYLALAPYLGSTHRDAFGVSILRLVDVHIWPLQEAFVILTSAGATAVCMIMATLASVLMHRRKVNLSLEEAREKVGRVEADLDAAADAIEKARMAAINSGYCRILARRVGKAKAEAETITQFKDLIANQPDGTLVDDQVKSVFLENFRAAHGEKNGATRVGLSIVNTVAITIASLKAANDGRLRVIGDLGLDDYPIRSSFSTGAVTVHVEKK